MMKKFKNALKSKRGQIGEILVVVVLIILAVLGIVKYVMPMFDKNQALSGAAGGQMDQLAKNAREAKWGVQGSEVTAQTVINTWNEVVRAKTTPSEDIQPTATLQYHNAANLGSLVSTETRFYDEYANAVGTEDVDRMATYTITTITYGTDGKLAAIVYTKR
ncbi:MAG: hypothetical protein ACM3UU_05980 [Ignavibacteriales bacterium]